MSDYELDKTVTMKQLAENLGIGTEVLRKWKDKHPHTCREGIEWKYDDSGKIIWTSWGIEWAVVRAASKRINLVIPLPLNNRKLVKLLKKRTHSPLFRVGEQVRSRTDRRLGTVMGAWYYQPDSDFEESTPSTHWKNKYQEGWIYVILWRFNGIPILSLPGFYGLAPENDLFCPSDYQD